MINQHTPTEGVQFTDPVTGDPAIVVESDIIPVRPSDEHEFLVEGKLVAQGYGVTPQAIRMHKRRNYEDLIEGKHWVKLERVTNCDARSPSTTYEPLDGSEASIFWTKRGVVRLGFFILSERARLFRDAAEDLIIAQMEQQASDFGSLPEHKDLNLADLLREKIETMPIRNKSNVAALEALYALYQRTLNPDRFEANGKPKKNDTERVLEVIGRAKHRGLWKRELCRSTQWLNKESRASIIAELHEAGQITLTDKGRSTLIRINPERN